MNTNNKKKWDVPHSFFIACTILSASLVILVLGFIFYTALPTFTSQGLDFFLTSEWSYSRHQYGIFNFMMGTMVLTAVTMLFTFPLALFTAIYLAEWAPPWLDKPITTMIELLVGIPSVIFGIFGFFVLANIFEFQVNPFLDSVLGFLPFFVDSDTTSGKGILLSATILTIMILPTVMALSREALTGVSREFREASFAVGATKWETIKKIVVPAALPGVITAFVLGMMRAMGETMAVAMLIGNDNKLPVSWLDGGTAMTSKILADIGYYVSFDEAKSALFAIGAVLFLIEFLFVALIRVIGTRFRRGTF